MAVLTSYPSTMTFITKPSPSDPPFYRGAADPGFETLNFSHSDHSITVSDARPSKASFSLHANGFAFADDAESSIPALLDALRDGNKEKIAEVYYPHVERLVKAQTGASRVVIFDHTVRRREKELKGKNPNGREQPASTVHCDQNWNDDGGHRSPLGAQRRVHQHLGKEADGLLRGRVQIINRMDQCAYVSALRSVWRPLAGPVLDWPLALMDASTLAPENVHPTILWRNRFELRGETVSISHADTQRWYYLDKQGIDEVTFIKIWDSDTALDKMGRSKSGFFVFELLKMIERDGRVDNEGKREGAEGVGKRPRTEQNAADMNFEGKMRLVGNNDNAIWMG
ncbi:hypothetical protein MMC11_004270 [Xylographa trunciseda]|nr:hypothetical protein [Xylographa trunciseda]